MYHLFQEKMCLSIIEPLFLFYLKHENKPLLFLLRPQLHLQILLKHFLYLFHKYPTLE